MIARLPSAATSTRVKSDRCSPIRLSSPSTRRPVIRSGVPGRARADAALAMLPEGEGRSDLVVLATALDESADDADQRLAGMAFTASERAVLRAAARAPAIAAAALDAERPSELARALRGLPVEALALAGAEGAAEPVRRWLGELRHVGLAIDGNDLIAAGVPRGPQIGRRLASVLERRLDGELGGDRDEQLAAALGQ